MYLQHKLVKENKAFFEKFLRSQLFINFIERAYHEEQGELSDSSIKFFKECMRRMQKENFRAVKAKQEDIIVAVLDQCSSEPIKYNVALSWPEFDKKTKKSEY